MGDINAKVDATTKEWNEQQGSLGEERINPNSRDSGIVLCVLPCSHKQPFPSKTQIYKEHEIARQQENFRRMQISAFFIFSTGQPYWYKFEIQINCKMH